MKNDKRGMTLLEITISIAIMAVISASAVQLAESTTRAIGTGTTVADLDLRAQGALEEIGEVLRTTSRANLTPPLPVAAPFTVEADTVRFARVIGIDGVTLDAQWGLPEQLLFEYSPLDPDDNVDNDGNGLVDEGQVVLIEDPGGAARRRILVRDVAEMLDGEVPGNGADDNGNGLVDEPGLSFEVHERGVTVRLTLARVEPGGQVVSVTTQRSFAFRNSGP